MNTGKRTTKGTFIARLAEKPRRRYVTCELPEDLVEWAEMAAKQAGTSRTAVIKAALEDARRQEEGAYA